MSFRQPKPIGDVLAELLARSGYGRVRAAGALVEAWRRAAGERLAASTRATVVRRGVLEVLVTNSTLVQEINFEKQNLIRRLAELAPEEKIRDLRFRVGPLR